MVEAEKFSKGSEQYQFFSKIWEFGKYAGTCEHGKLYLEVAGQIIELLKTHDFNELKEPLNGFYNIMSTYWNIAAAGNENDWNNMVKDMDELCERVPENQKEHMSKILVSLSVYFNDRSITEKKQAKSR